MRSPSNSRKSCLPTALEATMVRPSSSLRACCEAALRARCGDAVPDEVARGTAGRCGGWNGPQALADTAGLCSPAAMAPVASYSASWAIRRSCRVLEGERLRDEGVDECGGLLEGVLARADRDDVGVVVLAGELRRRGAPDEGGARTRHLVRGDRLAVAGAAEDDPEGLDARRPGRRRRPGAAAMMNAG